MINSSLSFQKLWNQTLPIYKAHFICFILINLVWFVAGIAVKLMEEMIIRSGDYDRQPLPMIIGVLGTNILFFLIVTWVFIMLVQVTLKARINNPVLLKDIYMISLKTLGRIFLINGGYFLLIFSPLVLSVVLGLLFTTGYPNLQFSNFSYIMMFFIGVIPAVYLGITFLFAPFHAVIKKKGWDNFSFSRRLTSKQFGQTFMILLILFVITLVIPLLTIILTKNGLLPLGYRQAIPIFVNVYGLFARPFIIVYITLFYFELVKQQTNVSVDESSEISLNTTY